MNIFLHGAGQPAMSLIHQCSVIITLIYLPFGKLAHIPFRPMSVFARNYREHYGEQSMKKCKVCGDEFVSTEQSKDVVDVLGVNDIEFQYEGRLSSCRIMPSMPKKIPDCSILRFRYP